MEQMNPEGSAAAKGFEPDEALRPVRGGSMVGGTFALLHCYRGRTAIVGQTGIDPVRQFP
jgi:hypothetical protein